MCYFVQPSAGKAEQTAKTEVSADTEDNLQFCTRSRNLVFTETWLQSIIAVSSQLTNSALKEPLPNGQQSAVGTSGYFLKVFLLLITQPVLSSLERAKAVPAAPSAHSAMQLTMTQESHTYDKKLFTFCYALQCDCPRAGHRHQRRNEPSIFSWRTQL